MKVYMDGSGKLRMFRPIENMNRFNRSCARLVLPVSSPLLPPIRLAATPQQTITHSIACLLAAAAAGQTLNAEALLECIKELVRLDRDWVPQGKGYSLYIRPCMISTYVISFPAAAAAAAGGGGGGGGGENPVSS